MGYVLTTHKFIAVLNKKVPVGRLMNALGHATAGLVAMQPDVAALRFGDYSDADGGSHPSISDNPFIVLQADNSNQIRTLRNVLKDQSIYFTDFTGTMIEGTYADQQARTRATPEAELEYYCLVTFGSAEALATVTKKFSLWRS